MGNVAKCMAEKPEAQLMRPDGVVVDYNYPIQVAMLMTLYPDYMVIHCSGERVAPGERRKIKIMDLEERLALGESYIMYPIPPEHKETFKTASSALPAQEGRVSYSRYLKTKISVECSRMRTKRGMKVKFDKRKKSWKITVRARSFISSVFQRRSPRSGSGKVSTDGGWVPLLDCDGNGFPTKPDLALQSKFWKPDLDDILESPFESR